MSDEWCRCNVPRASGLCLGCHRLIRDTRDEEIAALRDMMYAERGRAERAERALRIEAELSDRERARIIRELGARAERYREALEPFARYAEKVRPGPLPDTACVAVHRDNVNGDTEITIADLKRAHEALAATGDEAGSPLQQAERRLGEPRMVRRMGDFGVEVVPVDGDDGKDGDNG